MPTLTRFPATAHLLANLISILIRPLVSSVPSKTRPDGYTVVPLQNSMGDESYELTNGEYCKKQGPEMLLLGLWLCVHGVEPSVRTGKDHRNTMTVNTSLYDHKSGFLHYVTISLIIIVMWWPTDEAYEAADPEIGVHGPGGVRPLELMQVQQERFENVVGKKLPTSRTTVRTFLMYNATFRVRDTGLQSHAPKLI
ncbi:hypothetical protein EDB19DRAFT_1834962 [Suillus lakei]|nr:hypothetical protein EDB19DRAFT_1834962 [Suillus lakei]